VLIPKPTAHGTFEFSRTALIMLLISVFISLRIPVTPREETIYRKPFAFLEISFMRSSDVGAIN
jgi:hypothetical protein